MSYLDESLLPPTNSEEDEKSLEDVSGSSAADTAQPSTTMEPLHELSGSTTVFLCSFGFDNGPRPPDLNAEDANYSGSLDGTRDTTSAPCKTFDCRQLVNPSKASRKGRTGLDKRLRDEVLQAPGTAEFVRKAADRIVHDIESSDSVSEKKMTNAFQFNFGCHGGEHRSVAVAVDVAQKLQRHFKNQRCTLVATREDDVPEHERANNVRILVSHCNAR